MATTPTAAAQKPGFFNKLFGGGDQKPEENKADEAKTDKPAALPDDFFKKLAEEQDQDKIKNMVDQNKHHLNPAEQKPNNVQEQQKQQLHNAPQTKQANQAPNILQAQPPQPGSPFYGLKKRVSSIDSSVDEKNEDLEIMKASKIDVEGDITFDGTNSSNIGRIIGESTIALPETADKSDIVIRAFGKSPAPTYVVKIKEKTDPETGLIQHPQEIMMLPANLAGSTKLKLKDGTSVLISDLPVSKGSPEDITKFIKAETNELPYKKLQDRIEYVPDGDRKRLTKGKPGPKSTSVIKVEKQGVNNGSPIAVANALGSKGRGFNEIVRIGELCPDQIKKAVNELPEGEGTYKDAFKKKLESGKAIVYIEDDNDSNTISPTYVVKDDIPKEKVIWVKITHPDGSITKVPLEPSTVLTQKDLQTLVTLNRLQGTTVSDDAPNAQFINDLLSNIKFQYEDGSDATIDPTSYTEKSLSLEVDRHDGMANDEFTFSLEKDTPEIIIAQGNPKTRTINTEIKGEVINKVAAKKVPHREIDTSTNVVNYHDAVQLLDHLATIARGEVKGELNEGQEPGESVESTEESSFWSKLNPFGGKKETAAE